MQFHYDPESNILRMEISSGIITSAKEAGGTIIHTTASGVPVYIEILDAGSLITKLGKVNKAGSISPQASESMN